MKDREVWIDWLRVSACFLVLMTHASEPLYFGGEGALILTESDAFWEVFWINDTVGVVLMTMAWILLFRKITSSGAFYRKVLLPVSKASYGMYLCHMFVLLPVSNWMRKSLGIGNDGVLGFWTSPVQVLSVTILSFVVVAIVSVVVQKIPKVGKWVMG